MAPTLFIRDPHKQEKLATIHDALDKCSADHPVFYEDEVDIHLNPKICVGWQVRGQQNAWSRPVRMKNTIWQAYCIAVQEN